MNESYHKAVFLVRIFYSFLLYLIPQSYFSKVLPHIHEPGALNYPGITQWMSVVPSPLLGSLLLAGAIFFYLACILTPRFFIYRAGAFLTTLGLQGFIAGSSGVTHDLIVSLWISGLLCALPNAQATPEQNRIFKMRYLTILRGATGLMLFFYSATGFWKIAYGLKYGDMSSGLMRHVAMVYQIVGKVGPVGHLILNNEWLGYLGYPIAIYIQFFSLAVLFRSRSIHLWGLVLVFFHLGSFFIFYIDFSRTTFLVIMVLFSSPFSQSAPLKEQILGLPLLATLKYSILPKFLHKT